MSDPSTKLPLLLQRCKEMVEMAISPEHYIRPLEEGEQLLADLIEGQTQLSLALELLKEVRDEIDTSRASYSSLKALQKRLDASGLLPPDDHQT